MKHLLLAIVALANIAPGASIRDVDFKNFAYPFLQRKYVSVPSRLRWMPLLGANRIAMHDGQHRFPCVEPPCELLTLDRVDFGNISGVSGTTAIVTAVYHTGGTANWQYLYVIRLRAGKPQAMAWLEAESRSSNGLRSLMIDRGDLVLVVNDPDKRQGDCCSTGSITYRYRWSNDSFHQVGKPIRADDPQQ
jgi:hypothetical protein